MAATCSFPRADVSATSACEVSYSGRSKPADLTSSGNCQLSHLAGSSRNAKRERSQNWGQAEKCNLVQLVQKRLAVIEDKAGDTDAVRRRVQAWRDIHAEFSAKMGGDQRDVQRMREQWRRIKHWAKQEMKYFRETTRKRDDSKEPNQLAQYIYDMMVNFQRNDFRLRELQLNGDASSQKPEFRASPSPLSVAQLQAADSFEEPMRDADSVSFASEEVVPVAIDAIPVKLEPDGVELLDDDEATGGVAAGEAPAAKTSFVAPPPHQQPGGRVESNGRPSSSRKPTLPSWTKDFPDIVGAEPSQAVIVGDDDDDDDESEFLDDESEFLDDYDDEDDDDFGSFAGGWAARDNPADGGGRAYDPPPSAVPPRPIRPDHPGTAERLDKQRLSFARREFKRRMQMMEEEHARKMQILDVQRETAQLRKKLAFRQLKQRRPLPPAHNSQYSRHGHIQR